MKACRLREGFPVIVLLVSSLLVGCVTPPVPVDEKHAKHAKYATVDESAMLPLLGYFELLQRMSPQELARERIVLAAMPQTPVTLVRMAALLGQPRAPMDLARALGLLESVLKSREPVAVSLLPLARTMTVQYQERLKLEQQNEKLLQQLKESQRRSGELQEKLDALADIERSLPARPTAGDTLPGATR